MDPHHIFALNKNVTINLYGTPRDCFVDETPSRSIGEENNVF